MKKLIAFLVVALVATTAAAKTKGHRYDSYRGLVMAGYQGWFNAPGDGAGLGWRHYGDNEGFKPGHSCVEMWPYVREYKKTYATGFRLADGAELCVFSSNDRSTVFTHFRWMRQYGIDGVFMQRFVCDIRLSAQKRHFDKVLASAMDAANKYQRAICVMYDLSGIHAGEIKTVESDIDSIAARHHLFDRDKNPSYLYHNGRPLVSVWGVGFNDGREYTTAEVAQLVDYLKKRGFSVMLGVPTHWRELREDAEKDTLLHDLIRRCDVVMPWFVGRYDAKAYDESFVSLIDKDIRWAKTNHVDYAPLCYPGFSWKNLKDDEHSLAVPRDRGRFLWEQMYNAIRMGSQMLYIAMFDEIDEGTAIFKVASDVPAPVKGSTFMPLDSGLRPDHYLWLVGQAAQMLKGKRKLTAEMPER
jgi:hypothetical protein